MVKKFLLWIFAISVIVPLVLVGLLTLYVYLDSTGILVSYDNYVFQKKLHNALHSEKSEIPLRDLTDFEWDEMCFYPPYSYSGNLSARLDDGICNLQFLINGDEVKVFSIHRGFFENAKFLSDPKDFCFKANTVISVLNNQVVTINSKR